MNDYTRYKAIQTHFDGYAFRSRLEAKWATFFKALGIEYRYEDEGYDLDGTRYLPDFWLPDPGFYIEIKGQLPTEEEFKKARLLALHTQKMVFIISGNIASPDNPSLQDIRLEVPPSINKMRLNEDGEPLEFLDIPVSTEVLSLLQDLDDMRLRPIFDEGHLFLKSKLICYGSAGASRFAERLQQQAKRFPDIMPLLEQYEDDLMKVLTVEPGWHINFQHRLSFDDELEWVECMHCHKVTIGTNDSSHECPDKVEGDFVSNSPCIVAAYAAARQARFEHKKSRSEARS